MLTKLYKLIFDISICYTLGVFLLNYYGNRLIPITGFLLFILTTFLTTLFKMKKKWEIILVIVIPLGSLLFRKASLPEMVLFFLVWAYYSYVTMKERFASNRGVFVDMLKRFGLILLVLVFLALTGRQKFSSYVEVTGPYLSTSLISAIFLLRNLRTDNQMEQIKLYRRQQFMELVIFLVICILLTVLKAPQNMATGLSLMYHHLFIPILTFLLGIIGLIIMALVKGLYALIALISNNKEVHLLEPITGSASDKVSQFVENVTSNVEWVRPFLYSIGIIAVFVAIFFFFRWLMGDKLRQKSPEGVVETRESIEDARDKKMKLGKKPKDSRGIVRFYYGKFLLFLKLKQVDIRPQDTTNEIADKYNSAFIEDEKARRESAMKLKSLYRRSRYQITEEITSEDVKKAKKLYDTIKKSKVTK